jgi:cell wall-associated NlpC family hydrolase
MRITAAAIIILCCVSVCPSFAQDGIASGQTQPAGSRVAEKNSHPTMSSDDGLSILAAALDSLRRLHSENDCSHLAHAIYLRAGFPYLYASSSELYDGVAGFERITHSQPGDLIVWRGHVGIVVNPAHHLFFSFLRSGPGVDDWTSLYWHKRGQARFYRYVKKARIRTLTLSSRRPRQLLATTR